MAAILVFVVFYSRFDSLNAYQRQIEHFETSTITIENVTENYLEGEQRICDVWTRYINSDTMTMEEAADYISPSHVLENTSAHLISLETLTGLSTRPKQGTSDDYAVSYKQLGLLEDVSWIKQIGEAINVTRAFANPMNGEQSLAFCNRIALYDPESEAPEAAVLMRIVPISELEAKWVFPQAEFANAELAMIDANGDYIIKGTSFTVALDIPVADRQREDMRLDAIDVLIVDDDEILLRTAADTLESLGASVEQARSGAEALSMIAGRHDAGRDYGIVIIDWRMPDIDGIETIRRAAAHGRGGPLHADLHGRTDAGDERPRCDPDDPAAGGPLEGLHTDRRDDGGRILRKRHGMPERRDERAHREARRYQAGHQGDPKDQGREGMSAIPGHAGFAVPGQRGRPDPATKSEAGRRTPRAERGRQYAEHRHQQGLAIRSGTGQQP